MRLKKLSAILILMCAVVLSACSKSPQSVLQFQAMDTFMTVQTSSGETSNKIKSELELLDKLLSATNEKSDVSRLNKEKSATVDELTEDIIQKSVELCRETGGAVDLTVYPIVKAWGFTAEEYRVPSKGELDELLQGVDYSGVKFEEDKITIKKNMQVDLGAFAKGYAADRAVGICTQSGAKSALLNFGGTVAAVGTKAGGESWRVGISKPDNSGEYFGYVECSDKVVATSGGYERYFVGEDGKTYIHIIDPKTGCPVSNGITSVTVVCDSGIKSDALSTALFVMGVEGAKSFWHSDKDFDFVIATDSNTLYVTSGIKNDFRLSDSTVYKIEYVE